MSTDYEQSLARLRAALELERDAAAAELERERMRLAACGVVALADTPESAKRARDMHPDYRSASCDAVARRVDECMALRAERDALKADAELIDWLEANPEVEIGTESDDGLLLRTVHRVTGWPNDREWHEIAKASTLRAAISAAMKPQGSE